MDAAEFDAFHAGSYPRLVTWLSAAAGDPARAQDALDAAYARAWRRRRQLGRDVPAETWVRDTAASLLGPDVAATSPDPPGPDEVQQALQGLPRPPLTPAEVRRRGDSRARGRTALVAVAAAVFVVLGGVGLVVALPGGSGGGPGPPEELRIQKDELVSKRLGQVPPDFDLASGLSTEGRVGPELGYDPLDEWTICGTSYALGGITSEVLGVRSVDFGMQSGRLLTVARELDLSDADLNAHGIAQRYVARFEDCPTENVDGAVVRTTVARQPMGDEGWLVVRAFDDGTREVLQVVRVGSAVLVAGTRKHTGAGAALESFKTAEGNAIAPVVAHMCLWDDDPCSSGGDAA